MAVTAEVSVRMDVGEAETLIRVTGTRDAAVIVSSGSGEAIYLPPEEPEGSVAGESHYDRGSRSPYESAPSEDSPYGAAGSDRPGGGDAEGREGGRPTVGVEPTADGFRVLHPERVTDVRILS